MVAASKLKRAQDRAENSRPYSAKIQQVISNILANLDESSPPELLTGRLNPDGSVHKENILLIVTSSDRGLCGSFNTNLLKGAKSKIAEYISSGKNLKIITVGKKSKDALRSYKKYIIASFNAAEGKQVEFEDSDKIGKLTLDLFKKGEIDTAEFIYAKFINPLVQKVSFKSLIPLEISDVPANDNSKNGLQSSYEYEPDEEAILNNLLPKNISVQLFMGMLENSASEQGSRMTAMDSATKNAGEMIKKLTLQYNRSRQAHITKELIEIISGAEAV